MEYDLNECLELIFGGLCSWNCNLHNYADRRSHAERELLGHTERELLSHAERELLVLEV